MNKGIRELFIERLVKLNDVGIHSDVTDMVLSSFDSNSLRKLKSKGLLMIRGNRYLLTGRGFDLLVMES